VKYIPAWFPGAGFKKDASEAKKTLNTFVETPFQFTMHEMVGLGFPDMISEG
jgi:hypothetical protein